MMDVVTEARFWQQVMTDSRRTVICPPDLESRVKDWVDVRGMAGLITVKASSACPDGRVFVMDEQAMEATLRLSIPGWKWDR